MYQKTPSVSLKDGCLREFSLYSDSETMVITIPITVLTRYCQSLGPRCHFTKFSPSDLLAGIGACIGLPFPY